MNEQFDSKITDGSFVEGARKLNLSLKGKEASAKDSKPPQTREESMSSRTRERLSQKPPEFTFSLRRRGY